MNLSWWQMAGVTAWLGVSCWMFQTYLPARSVAANEARWQTEASRLLTAGLAHHQAGTLLIELEGGPWQIANRVDHSVRRRGLEQVSLAATDPRILQAVVVELLRRGYDEEELKILLGQARGEATTRAGLVRPRDK